MKYFNFKYNKFFIVRPEFMANAIVNMIQKATNGSVWMVDSKETYEVDTSNMFKFKKLE